MINTDDIRKQAQGWWKSLLQSHIIGSPFFPKEISRIGKIRSSQIITHFGSLQQETQKLYACSKNTTGKGYLIKTTERNFRKTGVQEIPDLVVFETLEDYLEFTGKKKEWRSFLLNYDHVVSSIPLLREWCVRNCVWLTDPKIMWVDLLKVCNYFINTPRPNLYIRQLPIEVHTKFIEENSFIIQSLLDFLIPGDIRDSGQKRFAERYFLKFDEPLIRLRMLDPSIQIFGGMNDVSIPLSEFVHLNLPVASVFVTENKMNFLTLPYMKSTMAIWSGGGFNVSYLRNVSELANKAIFYWGDIDEHGFQILHQIRSYYPHVKSVMMDEVTFSKFQDCHVKGESSNSQKLDQLTPSEMSLYSILRLLENKNRLEQEKIPQDYANNIIAMTITDL